MEHARASRFAVGVAVAGLLALGACGTEPAENTAASQGSIRIAVLPGAGYAANVAVVTRLLESRLGFQVEQKTMSEQDAWNAIEGGSLDAILEVSNESAERRTYIEEKKVAVSAGPTGNTSLSGWYVPSWMLDQYPDIQDWRNLNKYANLFKTASTGERGQILGSDASASNHDLVLVNTLGLNYAVAYSGSEDETIKAALMAAKTRTPLLFHFREPHWLFQQQKFTKINLPAHTAGCDADPRKVACDYPTVDLEKVVAKGFAEGGGDAFELLRNFNWSNDDQSAVANLITNEHLSPDEAAKRWMDAHESIWKSWLPQ